MQFSDSMTVVKNRIVMVVNIPVEIFTEGFLYGIGVVSPIHCNTSFTKMHQVNPFRQFISPHFQWNIHGFNRAVNRSHSSAAADR